MSRRPQAARGRFGRRFASADAVFGLLTEAASAGITLDRLQAWPAGIDQVDAASLASVLEPCAGHEVTTVIGPPVSTYATGDLVVQPLDWLAEAQGIIAAHD